MLNNLLLFYKKERSFFRFFWLFAILPLLILIPAFLLLEPKTLRFFISSLYGIVVMPINLKLLLQARKTHTRDFIQLDHTATSFAFRQKVIGHYIWSLILFLLYVFLTIMFNLLFVLGGLHQILDL